MYKLAIFTKSLLLSNLLTNANTDCGVITSSGIVYVISFDHEENSYSPVLSIDLTLIVLSASHYP